MFSSAGYFKGLHCPFFLSGLCERPYCHFKHSKPDDGKNQPYKTTSTSNSDKPPLDNAVPGEPSDILNGNTAENTEPRKVIGYNKYTGDPIYEEYKQEKYEVESPSNGVLIGVNKYTGEPEYSLDQNGSSNNAIVPEYNPTPIEELKKKNLNDPSNSQNDDSGEYDPEKNFSTKPITASHSFPLHIAAKRLVSYEPTAVKVRPAKIQRKTSCEFDSATFSNSDESQNEEENSKECISGNLNEEKSTKLVSTEETSLTEDSNDSKKCAINQTRKKDVNSLKYFENLLLSDPKKSSFEDIVKNKSTSQDSQDENSSNTKDSDGPQKKKRKYTKSFELSDSEDEEESENEGDTTKQSKHERSKKQKNSHTDKNNLKERSRKDSRNSETTGDSNIFDKISGKSSEKDKDKSKGKSSSDQTSSKSVRSKSNDNRSKSEKDSKHSERKRVNKESKAQNGTDNVKEKHSSDRDHRHESSRKKSSHDHSSSKKHSHRDKDKHSSKHKDTSNHSHSLKSESGSHKDTSNHSRSHKSESGSHKDKDKHSTSHSHSERQSSSKHKSHSGSSRQSHHKNSHSNSNDKSQSSDKSQSTSSSKSRSSSSSSKTCDKRRSSNSSDNSEKSSSKEKRLSTENKIVDINVDLFGEDSDPCPLDDSDFEHNPWLDDEDLDDKDPYDECLQIFKESQQANVHKPVKIKQKKTSPEKKKTEEPIVVCGKVRVAHRSSSTNEKNNMKKIVEKPYSKLSPAQVMHNRFMEMRKKALEEAAKLHSNQPSTSSSSTSTKTRVAHQPKSKDQKKPEKTVITTASKTQKRQARIPNVTNLARPQIPAEFGSKVPTNIRQRYLNLIIDECLKLCDDEEEAFKRGQEEEMAVYSRSNTKTVYLNVAINAIKRLRNEVSEVSPSPSKQNKINAMQLSHEAILGGKNATKATYTVKRSGNNSKVIENFKGSELYSRLSEYILTEDQLRDNGFPRPNPEAPGSAIINKDVSYKKNDRLHEKICVRCGKKFIVYPTGKYARQEECVYHWAKAWKRKVNGLFDSRYNCCQGDSSSEGCQVAKYHVHETNKLETLTGYMKTLPCSPPIDGDYGVFAMDCEMVYTTAGVELARISVCDQDNTAVYETFVKPDNDIVDLNTRFSGITDEDIEDVTTTLRDVQAVLLSLLNDKSILIGHSLESDLTAVKMIHNTVVDTSLVFPHRLGLPYKRALRTLMAEYLQKIIQDDVGGHDSMEDAASCMELMHMKLKDDARKKK